MSRNIGVTLSNISLEEVRQGMLEVLAEIVSSCGGDEKVSGADFESWLLQLVEIVKSRVIRTDWEHVWRDSAAMLDRSFLCAMVDIFTGVAQQYRAILPQLRRRSTSQQKPLPLTPSPGDLVQSESGQGQLDASNPHCRALLLQQSEQSASRWAEIIEDAVRKEEASTGHKPDVVVLPENAISGRLPLPVSELLPPMDGRVSTTQRCGTEVPTLLLPLAAVAEAMRLFIVCGTVKEPSEERTDAFFTTSVVLGPNGNPVGAYRKRRIHDHTRQVAGDRPLLFEMPRVGLAAVMICLDAEDPALRAEVVRSGARCVLNPVCIPLAAGQHQRQQWEVALRTAAEPFYKLCNENDMAWLRCDQPRPCALGSTQAILPEATHCVGTSSSASLSVVIPSPLSSGFLTKVPPAVRERQRQEQNCGPRCTIRSLSLEGEVLRLVFARRSTMRSDCAAGERGPLLLRAELASGKMQTMETSPLQLTSAMGSDVLEEPATYTVVGIPLVGANDLLPQQDVHFRVSPAICGIEACLSESFTSPILQVPTAQPPQLLAVSADGNAIATVSDVNSRTWISLWTFEYNCVPMSLSHLMDIAA